MMKTIQTLSAIFALVLSCQTGTAQVRAWTQSATGKVLRGSIQSKKTDNSELVVQKENSSQLCTLKTKDLSKEDQEYVAQWARGIVTRPSNLDQARGGYGNKIDDLDKVLSSFNDAKEDLAAHPTVEIFTQIAGHIATKPVTYLMQRTQAETLLPSRIGPVSKLQAVAPGFPDGMVLHIYDIRLRPYNRMTLMVDGADQVVAIQFLASNENFSLGPVVDEKISITTCDFMAGAWRKGGATAEIIGNAEEKNRYVVNLIGKDTVTMFIPVPVIRQILFNVQNRKKGMGRAKK